MIQRTALRQLMLVSVLSLTIAACSSDDDETPASGSGDTSEMAPGGGSSPTVSSAFDGNWIMACSLEDDDSPEDGYEVTMLAISGETATARSLMYLDSACQMPDPELGEVTTQVSIVYPGGTTTTPQGVATHVNVTTESILFDGQPLTAEQQEFFETFGGFDPTFDIALIENSVLFFGDTEGDLSGDSAALRPTALEADGFAMQ